jgi:hypothetical protein
MERRSLLFTSLAPVLLNGRGRAQEAQLPSFWRSSLAAVENTLAEVKKGQVRQLGRSAGGRPIHVIAYGKSDNLPSTANYNSACAAADPAAYRRKDGNQKPVVLLLGPVHGQELEGIVGLTNLIAVAETGRDLRGREWRELAGNLAACRCLIVPVGNPDGRTRCPVASWVGASLDAYEKSGMGTTPEGASYKYPKVKRFHPMRGPVVGSLGAYFNDAGVNLMHDDWFDPMAQETAAFLKLAREEAPDFAVSLHSHASAPSVEQTAYAPLTVKETIRTFADRLYARYRAARLPNRKAGGEPAPDGAAFPPPSFNLASAIHHVCGAVAFVHECMAGLADKPYARVTHDELLDIEMLLFEELFRFAEERPVKWTTA